MTKVRGRSTAPNNCDGPKDSVAKAALVGPAAENGERLTEPEKRAIAEAHARWEARRHPYHLALAPDSGNGKLGIAPDFGDAVSWIKRRLDAFGTASPDFAGQMVGRLAAIALDNGETRPDEEKLNAALAAVDGIRPENELEALLAVQMYATHEVAMAMLTRTKRADNAVALQNCSPIATKLLRTFTAQIEALTKLRRGGEQVVRVEHVHVYPGGQAIVGSVTHPGTGGEQKNEGQPHAKAIEHAMEHAFEPTVWSEGPEREPVPVPSGDRKAAVPDARRRTRKRSAAR